MTEEPKGYRHPQQFAVIGKSAAEWGRANGYGQLLDDVLKFKEAWDASWKTRLKERQLLKTLDIANKKVERAQYELDALRGERVLK